jgi:16S rRNA G966 N2-methylase RsmD
MEYHEFANLFPMMSREELDGLCNDMEQHGYDKTLPIVLYEDKILDGRNRQLAADTVGVEPEYMVFEGNNQSALDFVIRHNLNRRHLNETQRATIAEELSNMKVGDNQYKSGPANLPTLSQSKVAEMLNVSARTVRSVRAVKKDAPELYERMKSGEISAYEAEKELRKQQRNLERGVLAETGSKVPVNSRWNIELGNIETYQTSKKFDFIITDPPYPKEYLSLFGILAKRAKEWLKPSGLLIVMSGQSYLDQIYEMFSKELIYYWTACYLTPGQPTPLRQRQVNTTWKPILIYGLSDEYKGKIFGDVYTSDANDKEFHKWGQSTSGMFSLVSQICLPGQTIFDPFCGAGTTGIAALRNGCFFDGIDIDQENVNISKSRLA